MRFEINVNIRATPDTVWQFITNTQAVGNCVAGLESLRELEPAHLYLATVIVPMGQMNLRCTAEVEWLHQTSPSDAALQVRVGVRQPGTARRTEPYPEHNILAHNALHLVNGVPGVTQMQWRMDVNLLGGYAGIPPHLIHPLIQKHSQSFFTRLKQQIENQP